MLIRMRKSGHYQDLLDDLFIVASLLGLCGIIVLAALFVPARDCFPYLIGVGVFAGAIAAEKFVVTGRHLYLLLKHLKPD